MILGRNRNHTTTNGEFNELNRGKFVFFVVVNNILNNPDLPGSPILGQNRL